MEINITSLLSLDMFPLSHSAHEGGQDAGRNSWKASQEKASEIRPPLLDTEEKLQAMRDFARSSGGWTREEIEAWPPEEINALFLQWVARDTRLCPATLEGVTFYERNGEWYYDHEDTPEEETGPFESRSEAYSQAASEHYRAGCYPSADSLEETDWEETEAMASAGQISGNMYKGSDNQVYFYLGN
jgi:hypothetical protein